jgi:hypothetical protein
LIAATADHVIASPCFLYQHFTLHALPIMQILLEEIDFLLITRTFVIFHQAFAAKLSFAEIADE